MARDLCEWNPDTNQPATPAYDGRQRRGCPNQAVYKVGSFADYRLCESCAKLLRFDRCKKWVLDPK